MTSLQNKPESLTLKLNNQNNNNKLKDWIKSHLTETITYLVILSLLLFGGSIWNTWIAYRGFRNNIQKGFVLQDLSGQIVYLDEVLTMSARMAASTGNLVWEARYNNFVNPLDSAIKEVITLAPEAYQDNANQTDAANIKLVEMETQAFDLIKENKSKQALELLLSDAYQAQKQIYSQGINNTLENIKQITTDNIELYSNNLRNSFIFSGISLVILILSWWAILILGKSYIAQRQKALDNLSQSQTKLLKLNQELEASSEQIKEQEQKTQEENELLQTDIGHILEVVSAVEEGDLTITADVNDRLTGLISDTLNRLLEQLSYIINQVNYTTQQVTTKANQFEKVALNTSNQVEKQTESILQCQQLIAQVTDISQQNLTQELAANQAIKEAEIAVKQGEAQMTTMTRKIGTLQQQKQQIVNRVKTLTDYVELTSQFNRDQKRVAALTRVLALNASMIANRASQQQDPEQFMSIANEFATVANQVNELAVETNQNLVKLQQRTDQIKTVVSGLNQDTQEINLVIGDFILGLQDSYQMFAKISNMTTKVVEVEQEVIQSSEKITNLNTKTLTSIENIADIAANTEKEMNMTWQQSQVMGNLLSDLSKLIQFFRIKKQ